MMGWDRCGFHKKRVRTRYVELVSLHAVGSAGDVILSGAYSLQIVDTLFFMLKWDWCGFHKKRTGTRYAKLVFLHPVGSACHVVHSCASGA
jgi:hypothetical protein